MKTLLVALIGLAAALALAAPAYAKDQWVIAFGEEPFTLNPAGWEIVQSPGASSCTIGPQ